MNFQLEFSLWVEFLYYVKKNNLLAEAQMQDKSDESAQKTFFKNPDETTFWLWYIDNKLEEQE